MGKRVQVPIRVRQAGDGSGSREGGARPAVDEPEPPVVEEQSVARQQLEQAVTTHDPEATASQEQEEKIETLKEEVETWRDRALRRQAEIENFRKRQRRLAEERIEADRARLLRNFLTVADDLDRALSQESADGSTLREGVSVTQRSLRQILRQEGVQPIDAEGDAFDPTWHEAVGVVSHDDVDAERGTVVNVTQTGYRIGERLLRPARVIVAR